MQAPRLNKIATRVILLQTGPSGGVTPVTLYKKSRKKKKSTWGLRGVEGVLLRLADAQKAFANTLVDRSKSSRRKKANGSMRDLGRNVFQALNAGRKKLRIM